MNFSLIGVIVAGYVISRMVANAKMNKSKQENVNIDKKSKQKTEVQQATPKSELIKEIMEVMNERKTQLEIADEQPADKRLNVDDMPMDTFSTTDSPKSDPVNNGEIPQNGRAPEKEEFEILDIDSKEDLAKAMVLKEILGPPLSMR